MAAGIKWGRMCGMWSSKWNHALFKWRRSKKETTYHSFDDKEEVRDHVKLSFWAFIRKFMGLLLLLSVLSRTCKQWHYTHSLIPLRRHPDTHTSLPLLSPIRRVYSQQSCCTRQQNWWTSETLLTTRGPGMSSFTPICSVIKTKLWLTDSRLHRPERQST